MRKSREEAALTRKRIVTTASGEFRKNGIVATGLNNLMSAAGLTHGGFYKHFESKDQLVAEACAEAVETANSAKGWLLRLLKREGLRLPTSRPVTETIRPPDARCPRSAANSPEATKNPGGGDGRLPEARRDHGRAVRKAPAGYRQAACPGRGIDDDWRADHVADRDRPGVVGGDSQGGRDELGRWLTRSARGNSSGLLRAAVTSTAGRRLAPPSSDRGGSSSDGPIESRGRQAAADGMDAARAAEGLIAT